MSAIDTRVVEAQFKNDQFGRGVSDTISMLDRLKAALKLDGASKGIDDVSQAAGSFNGSAMEAGAGRIGQSFTAMQAIALGALASVGAKAVAVGTQVANSLTLAPVMDGFREYETNMNSIQTILANTQAAGSTLSDVEGALQKLNTYSDQTIYNFSEMARNIGTFTAAGVNLETSTNAIKGIANLAALSGSNSQQASTAMYQLSQAISAGKVSLEDWNSVQNAGMGGAIFQRALAQTAVAMGKIDKGALQLSGDMQNVTINGESFRNSISTEGGKSSWLTSDVLTNTLAQFTGDLNDAELAAQGFNDAQIQAIKAQAATAVAAATEVKTFSGLMDTLKEGVTSGWSQTFGIIFGGFNESKTLFTGLSNTIGGFLGGIAQKRNEMLQGWKDLGGRDALIEGLKNAFQALFAILKPIGEAFRQIFPATTAQQLFNMTASFRDFTATLKPSQQTIDNIRRTFAGFFAILGIGWELLKAGAGFVADLLGAFSGGSGGILSFTGTIGDFLVALHQAIKSGDAFGKVFDALGAVLTKPIELLMKLGRYIGSLFDNVDAGGSVSRLTGAFEPVMTLGDRLSAFGDKVAAVFGRIWQAFQPLVEKIKGAAGALNDALGGLFSNLDLDSILSIINTGVFATVGLAFKNMLGRIFQGGGDTGGPGFFDGIKEAISGLTDTLTAMQNALKAQTLLAIAAALGILTLSVIGLSKVDPDDLKKALAAITAMFIQLGAAMLMFSKIATPAQTLKVIATGAALILLATAIRILAGAVEQMAGMNLGDLARGLLGITVMIRSLAGATEKMSGNTKGMVTAGAGLILLAAAIKILVSAVTDLSGLSWEEMAKGLVGVGALLTSLILFTKFADADKGGLSQGLGLILLATGIKILAGAMQDMAQMSWEEMARGLVGTAGGIVAISAALKLIPASSILSAAAVLIVAQALGTIGDAVENMSGMAWDEIGRGITVLAGSLVAIAAALKLLPPTSLFSAAAIFVVAQSLSTIQAALGQAAGMSWEEIGKGMVVLAGSLGIIAAALLLMTGTLMGSAALVVAVGALWALYPILMAFSGMTWGEIAAGLTMLAGTFAVIGVAGLLLSPVILPLMGLGIAIGLLGVAVLAAGVGVLAFATALGVLAAAGAAGTAAIVGIVEGLIGLIPDVARAIGEGVVEFARVIAVSGPAILGAITAVLTAFLQAIIITAPQVGAAFLTLVFTALTVLEQAVPRLVDAGLRILLGFLRGIRDNIGQMVTVASQIIVNFLNGIAQNLPSIIQAGVNLIISFVNGVANAIRNNSAAMGAAGGNLATAIVEGMVRGIAGGIGSVVTAAKNLASSALNAAKEFLGIHSPSKEFEKVGKFTVEGFVVGLTGSRDKIDAAVKTMTDDLHSAMDAANKDIDVQRGKLADLGIAHGNTTRDIQATTRELYAASHAKKVDANRVQNLKDRLVELNQKQSLNNMEIRQTNVALHDSTVERDRAAEAIKYVTENMQAEQDQLRHLADGYDQLTKLIDEANKKLDDARKTRDDYEKSIAGKYSDLPDLNKETGLIGYMSDLRSQIQKTQEFATAVQQLRDIGLSDQMYGELLAKGPDAMPFITQLLAGGKSSVEELNDLGSQLTSAAQSLGSAASKELYQAAVDSAAGLVQGLENSQQNIKLKMEQIAGGMVQAVKDRLGIHSPSTEMALLGEYSSQGLAQGVSNSAGIVSQAGVGLGTAIANGMVAGMNAGIPAVSAAASAIAQAALTTAMSTLGVASPSKEFTKIGQWSSEGLAIGLENYSGVVANAAENVGNEAIRSMSKTISGLGDLISGDMDVNPVITPVLDLSGVREGASAMGSIFDATPLSIDGASAGYRKNQAAAAEGGSAGESTTNVTFVQNNNSPKALSSATLYRQTNNQLARVKGALTNSAK
jgi:tape measure domain-containing protein